MSILDKVSESFLLHRGGEASLYRLESSGKTYCLKCYAKGLNFDESVIQRIQEAKTSGVFAVKEYGCRAGMSYLVYDFVNGVSLGRFDCLDAIVALYLLRSVVRTLKELSEYGIHHGDLSPSNVIVDASLNVTVVDFGIVGPGTLAYAAPERFHGGRASEKSDIFGLAMLLFRLISGTELIDSDDYESFANAQSRVESMDVTSILYERFLARGVNSDYGILKALEPLWKGCLAKDPDGRVSDLDELDELLEIAFDFITPGDVLFEKSRASFATRVIEEIGTESATCEKSTEFPLKIGVTKISGRNKKLLLPIAFILILLITVALALFDSDGVSVDETGNALLRKSRNLEIQSVESDSNFFIPEESLDSLPQPGLNP